MITPLSLKSFIIFRFIHFFHHFLLRCLSDGAITPTPIPVYIQNAWYRSDTICHPRWSHAFRRCPRCLAVLHCDKWGFCFHRCNRIPIANNVSALYWYPLWCRNYESWVALFLRYCANWMFHQYSIHIFSNLNAHLILLKFPSRVCVCRSQLK